MTDQLKGYDQFVQQALKAMDAPGCSVAVLKDDQVIHCQGYGLRNIENGSPVDTDTLFAIGSTTKAFTTAAMAILVDRGQLEWDKPLREYIPWFKLYDPAATERITPRDIVCHRTGLPRHDFAWYGSSVTRKDAVAGMRYLEPNKDFRQLLQYNNLMFMVAGYLIEVVDGRSWEKFIQEELLNPIGMAHTRPTEEEAKVDPNCATPYDWDKNQWKKLNYAEMPAIAPAGSTYSSCSEMIRWVSMHLNDGKFEGKQLVSKVNLDETHRPNMVITGEFFGEMEKFPEFSAGSYGLGWFYSRYRGELMVQHTGHIDGFSAYVSFMPQHRLGVVAFANIDGSAIPFALGFNAYERLLGMTETPWVERFNKIKNAEKAAMEQGKKNVRANRVKGTHPTHALSAYTGVYKHLAYAEAKVFLEDQDLHLLYNGLDFKMVHVHYNVFELENERWPIATRVNFAIDVNGNIASLSVPLEPNVKDIVFIKQPDSQLSSPAYLEKFAGVYSILERDLAVSCRASQLFAEIPGQAEMVLLPYLENQFKAAGAPNVLFTFKAGSEGQVTSLEVDQAGLVASGPKKE
jgi:CubicO group peptidase (beta-lactamase class C family)